MTPLLVLGSTGRLGRMLRTVWAEAPASLCPVWQAREGGELAWDILRERFPGGVAPGGIVLNLAGVTDSSGRMEDNVALGLAGFDAAAAAGARHLFLLSSAAVYGAGQGSDLSEDDLPQPANAYGASKLEMERQALARSKGVVCGLTLLRLGNVAGADALLGRARPDVPVTLDPVPGGGGPVRSYIGPRSLADVLARLSRLAAEGQALPKILNLAAAPPVAMQDLLTAAALAWRWGEPTSAVVPRVSLSTDRMQALCPLPPEAGEARTLVDEWRSLS